MKQILISLVVVLGFAAGGCRCTAEKNAVTQIQATHELVAIKLLEYVERDSSLSTAEKADWKALVESDQRNIAALKKSLEE